MANAKEGKVFHPQLDGVFRTYENAAQLEALKDQGWVEKPKETQSGKSDINKK